MVIPKLRDLRKSRTMYSSSSLGASSKPSWAFDVADGYPRSKSTLQNYRIPYPLAPDEEPTEGQQFVCARAFLVFVNILFFVIGFAAVVTSIAVAAKPERCEMCHSVLNILLTFGLITSLIAAMGIYGALSNSYKLLLVYVTFVAFFFMVQMVVFFWPLFGRFNFQRRMHTIFREKMRNHPEQLVEVLHLVQQRVPCCGVDGPLDYHSVGLQLPLSCCASLGGDGQQCALRTRPPSSTTPMPGNITTTLTAGNITSSGTTAHTAVTSPSTAPPGMVLPDQRLLDEETTSEDDETFPEEDEDMSPDPDDTSTEADEMATEADESATEADESATEADESSIETSKTSKAEKTSTAAPEASTEIENMLTDTNGPLFITEKTTQAHKVSTPKPTTDKTQSKRDIIPKAEEASLKAVKALADADGLTDEETSWMNFEPESVLAAAPDAAADPLLKSRLKRSFTDAPGVSHAHSTVTVGSSDGSPDNASMIVLNSTGLLMGNFSLNITDEEMMEELVNNRTNLTGGPELWDIHHVNMRGCYGALWQVADQHRGYVVGVTLAAVALLSLQLVVLCTAHHVARGDFIQHG